MPRQTFVLNGERVSVDVADDVRRAVGAPRPARRDRPQVRLRHQRLQGVYVARERPRVQPLLGAGR